MRTSTTIISVLAAVSLALLLTGCGSAELETAHSVESGPYQIEILAPGGVFIREENSLMVRATLNGEVVELTGGRLDLHMPEMGAMGRMDTGTGFAKSGNHLGGDIFFEMAGGWQGSIEVTTADGETISESLRVRVR